MCRVELYGRVRRACYVDGMSVREAARFFGLHRDTVRVSHETIRAWEFRFAPPGQSDFARQAPGPGRPLPAPWYLDETYVKVGGRWCYLYGAINRDGNLLYT